MSKEERAEIIGRFEREDCYAFFEMMREGRISPEGWAIDRVKKRLTQLRKGVDNGRD